MDWPEYLTQGLEIMFLGMGTFFDVKDRELPVIFLVVFGSLGIIWNLLWRYQSLQELVLGVSLGGTFLAVGFISKEQIGYGDGMGLVILGVFEGVKGLVPVIVSAFLFSGVYGVWNILGLKKSGSETMPFYPFLLLALIGVKLL